MKTNWDPQQYARFARERRLPFDALLGLVQPDTGMRVVDLGCGNGPLTLELAERFRDSHVVGVDSSAEMLASAEAARHGGGRNARASLVRARDDRALPSRRAARSRLLERRAALGRRARRGLCATLALARSRGPAGGPDAL